MLMNISLEGTGEVESDVFFKDIHEINEHENPFAHGKNPNVNYVNASRRHCESMFQASPGNR